MTAQVKILAAVTTAPRKENKAPETIASLHAAGFDNVVAFAEPESEPLSCKTITNKVRLGVWSNWVQSVRYALTTDADVIITVQDDADFHPDSREFLESILWPAANCGFVSLYIPKHYTIDKNGSYKPPGVYRVVTNSLWGAVALAFPRAVLERALKHTLIKEWRGVPPKKCNMASWTRARLKNKAIIQNSDTAIGKIMNSMGKTMWFVDPSPVSHIGSHSSIGHGDNTGRRNAIRIADKGVPLHSQVFSNGNGKPNYIDTTTSLAKQIPRKLPQINADGSLKKTGEEVFDKQAAWWFSLNKRMTMTLPLEFWTVVRDEVLKRPGQNTLEFGTGVSTAAFDLNYHVALENDAKQSKMFECAIFSELRKGWYRKVPKGPYGVVLLDGPWHGVRTGVLREFEHLLQAGSVFFMDDYGRDDTDKVIEAKIKKLFPKTTFKVHVYDRDPTNRSMLQCNIN